ncbi:CTD phosphatase Fcp1 [Mucor circinelloides]
MVCSHTNNNSNGGSCSECGNCSHEVIFGGLCALCGAVVDQDEENNTTSNHIDMTHDASGITVSKKEAERIQKEDEARLLKARKLSLIVDLDQTILHAAWEPHIAEWVDNHKDKQDSRAKDMSTFTLDGSKYTIKLRPGTINFLKDMSKLYEMHVYTMGTRAYAKAVAAVIDPTMELFQDRILTRDENGSLTKKRLDRLFPADQSKVVVLDDRADVWDHSPNLIQIKPYEYFAGVGDINAPPNAQSTNVIPPEILKDDVNTAADVNSGEQSKGNELDTTVNKTDQVEASKSSGTVHNENKKLKNQHDNEDDLDLESSSGSSSEESEDEDDAKINAGHDEKSTQDSNNISAGSNQPSKNQQESSTPSQANSNSEDLSNSNGKSDADANNASIDTNTSKDEPDNEAVSRAAEEASPNVEVPSQEKLSNNILASFNPKHEDTDRILQVINQALTDVHDEFYRRVDEGESEPHVAIILPEIKRKVLKGCTLVFSGVIPLHYRPQDATIWKMAVAFGATCLEELTGKVTHLVAANAGTSKVNTARKYQHIKIVSPPWLMNSIWNFKRENETPYIIPVEDVSSEIENPEEASLDFDEEEVELDMDWSDSEIDEALADDTGTEGNGTPLPASSLEPSTLADEITPTVSDDDDEEMNEDDWLGDVLDGMDDSEAEGDYGDADSVASASSVSSTSSRKSKRRLEDDDLHEHHSPSSKRQK